MGSKKNETYPPTIREVKKRLHGTAKSFDVDLLLREGTLTLVRFVTVVAMKGDENRFPAGSYTYGFFWDDRNYDIYRMHLPDGTLYAHRFDVLKNTRFTGKRLEWTDLLLDVWIYPDGQLVWKDEEQVEEYLRKGWMSREDLKVVERTRAQIEGNWPAILAEAAALIARLEQPSAK